MKQNLKKSISKFLVIVMILTMLPLTSISSQAVDMNSVKDGFSTAIDKVGDFTIENGNSDIVNGLNDTANAFYPLVQKIIEIFNQVVAVFKSMFEGDYFNFGFNYIEPSETNEKLDYLLERSASFYEKDYTAESWAKFEVAHEKAKSAVESKNVTDEVCNELKSAIDSLELDLDTYQEYTFDNGSLSEHPMTAVVGTVNDDESKNISVPTGKGFHLETEEVNGVHQAIAKYTLAQPLYNKVLGFYFRDLRGESGNITDMEVTVLDSKTGNGFILSNTSETGKLHF